MSDTTNVMKGTRSGVQKLIRDECSDIFYVVCICHLADLAIKAGMQTLSVDLTIYLWMFFTTFFTVVKKNSLTSGILFLHQNHRQYLLCDVLVAI